MGDGAGSLVYVAGSGRTLLTVHSGGALIAGFDYASGVLRLIAVNENGELITQSGGGGGGTSDISGNHVEAHIMSGEVTTSISGNQIDITENSGIGVTVNSGVGVINQPRQPSVIRSRDQLQATSASGGVELESGDVISVTIKMLETGSGDINQSGYVYIGGTATGDAPNSGHGLRLSPGDSYTVAVDNFNKVAVFATNSGEWVSYIGNQY